MERTSSGETAANESYASRLEAQKKLVEELKIQWKLLWSERFDDKLRAEGVSVSNYEILRVERGLIIHATRNFKALSFKEILEQQKVENPERYIQPDIRAGGWNKFIKTTISKPQQNTKRSTVYCPEKKEPQQPKKGGRGWLHK